MLNHLHKQADILGSPVDATVLDHQQHTRLRVLVQPDGASELLGEPQPLADPATPPSTRPQRDPNSKPLRAAAPSTGQDDPVAQSGARTSVMPAIPTEAKRQKTPSFGPAPDMSADPEEPAPSPSTTTPVPPHVRRQSRAPEPPVNPAAGPRQQTVNDGRNRPFPPPEFTAPSSLRSVPTALTEMVDEIAGAIGVGDLRLARILVSRMKQRTLTALGQDHPHTLEVYSFEAYVEHLSGNQDRATSTLLNLAELRHRQGDPRAHEEVIRAAATWDLLTSPSTLRILGVELLSLWKAISGSSHSTVDAQGMRHIESRLAGLLTEKSFDVN
ncbi:hypothetical protein AB0F46_38895 [Streptomyces sp. NPDC026665]|uniref:hypothetical protein n=1 Tax=Streptomyces sp. NPDC026665 TaxID=3154798 RepID=UPI0033D0D061